MLTGVVLVVAVTVAVALVRPHVATLALWAPYLVAVTPVALWWGVRPAVSTAVLSAAMLAFLLPPVGPARAVGVRDALSLAVFLLVAVAVGVLAARARRAVRTSARLAEEQSALRRVATLVARDGRPAEVFDAVAREVGQLTGADFARLCRYEPDGSVLALAGWGSGADRLMVGEAMALDGPSAIRAIRETGAPYRLATFTGLPGGVAAEARAAGIRSTVGCPITVAGRLWGVVAVSTTRDEPFPPDTERRLTEFTGLVATAIANAESHAQLAASRARVVAAGDETRRRLERDLHDGAQQRLVSLALRLRLVQDTVPARLPELRAGIGRGADDLTEVVDELRELAHGLHPAILTDGGLGPALRTLARRSAVPVELRLAVEDRYPAPLEAAAYYVVAEALTNTAKHAGASYAEVAVEPRDGALCLRVSDDGAGGADPRHGSGLIGLRDRVEAVGGSMTVTSPAGGGTLIEVSLPVTASGNPGVRPAGSGDGG
jgi:signal transduction histidine kinase